MTACLTCHFKFCDIQKHENCRMASNLDTETVDEENLSAIFQEGLDLFNNLGKIDEPTNSINVQNNVKKAMRLLEKATRLVSVAGVFSSNETVEEIPTSNLQYLLLPALLGSLSLKLTSGERKDIVQTADIYFKDFLHRCNDYGLSDYHFQEKSEERTTDDRSEFDKLKSMVNTRANKIQRFNEQKQLKRNLEDLKKNMANENVDEEIKRNYFLTMLQIFIHEAVDELHSIEMEKPILEHMATLSSEDRPKPKRIPVQPLKPVIITRDDTQKKVYGLGYPSIPTMTVQEFYDKRVREGIFPDPHKSAGPLSLQQAALSGVSIDNESDEVKKEEMMEQDDPELLERMRQKDEFKDDHRRGWGNRMNRS